MKLNTFLNLLPDTFLRFTIGRIESGITTKGAATCADFSVSIGATETCVNADFMYPATELLREVVAVAVESPLVAPRIYHFVSFFVTKPSKPVKTLFWVFGKHANRLLSGGNAVASRHTC